VKWKPSSVLAAFLGSACVEGQDEWQVMEPTVTVTSSLGGDREQGTVTGETTGNEEDQIASSESGGAGENETGGHGDVPSGCASIDYLLLIDNSASMLSHQRRFTEALALFATSATTVIPSSQSSQVMVVKPDVGWGGHCVDECLDHGACSDVPAFDCASILAGCDAELGAGVLHPHGFGGINERCALVGDSRYIRPEEPNVLPPLQCLTDLGVRFYDTPTIADALRAALTPQQLGTGGCNEGFLRDGTLLVVMILTDKDDTVSSGDPQAWYEAVIASRGGDPDRVVVIGLFAEDPDACTAGAHTPGDLGAFVELFPHAFRLNICAEESYEWALADTLAPILEVCEAMGD
jgi:hypothetical protein